MEQYTYIIIGGGMTADSAVRGIRELDSSNRIALFSQETHPPYDRPPLSKGLWMGKPLDSIWRKTDQETVTLHLGKTIGTIDATQKIITDSEGEQYEYEKLLFATGGIPRRLECADPDVLYFRTYEDYLRLRALYDQGEEFVVIGSGYIGTEIAASLAMNGKKVTMLFRSPSIGSQKYPKNFSLFLNAYYTEQGVKLIPEDTPLEILKENTTYQVRTKGGKEIRANGVIAGLGILPNTTLAEQCGLEIDNGIVVDAQLKTSLPDIYAAGDVANFHNPLLEKRLRMEHEDTANTMGKQAGRNLAGAEEEYTYLPYFYSDLFELGYEAIGELGADMEIVEDWQDLYRKGVLYYLRDGYLRGAVLWGIWEQVDRIRSLIASKQKCTPEALRGTVLM